MVEVFHPIFASELSVNLKIFDFDDIARLLLFFPHLRINELFLKIGVTRTQNQILERNPNGKSLVENDVVIVFKSEMDISQLDHDIRQNQLFPPL